MSDGKIVLLLSGPNLNLLGDREPEIYGTATLDDHVANARAVAEQHGARRRCAGIVVNAGALTHYGWSLHDALATFDGPIIELHLSNPLRREAWRHTSVVAPVATATIAGLGGAGYPLAVEAMAGLLA